MLLEVFLEGNSKASNRGCNFERNLLFAASVEKQNTEVNYQPQGR